MLVKSLIHSVFSLITRNKTLYKTTCRTPSANPHQLCTNYLKSFVATIIIFLGFKDFLIYLTKYLLSFLNFPYLNLQLFFCKSNESKKV